MDEELIKKIMEALKNDCLDDIANLLNISKEEVERIIEEIEEEDTQHIDSIDDLDANENVKDVANQAFMEFKNYVHRENIQGPVTLLFSNSEYTKMIMSKKVNDSDKVVTATQNGNIITFTYFVCSVPVEEWKIEIV